jgi:hypothetical protein
MRTQGAFSLFQRVAMSHTGSSKTFDKFQENATVQGYVILPFPTFHFFSNLDTFHSRRIAAKGSTFVARRAGR